MCFFYTAFASLLFLFLVKNDVPMKMSYDQPTFNGVIYENDI